MKGLIMDYGLTVPAIVRRAEAYFHHKPIITLLPDKTKHRYTIGECIGRAKQLALALEELGIESGDRVATFCWNHYQHMEAYLGVPAAGRVLHTLNLRLHPDDLIYIASHAGDKVAIVDDVLWPLFEKFKDQVDFKHVIVISHTGQPVPSGTIDYEELLGGHEPENFTYPDLDERQAAAMCYTSGTTGKPKGVAYTHRGLALHSLANGTVETLGVRERDVALPVVPMFHANAWGFPHTCCMFGTSQVFPGPHLDPPSLLELLAGEKVTVTAGVPTIWMGILQILDKNPGKFDLSNLRAMVVGGSAAPQAMIEGFQKRHGLCVVHAWGMTEMSPMGTIANLPSYLEDASEDEQFAYRARQGVPAPFIEVRGRNEDGEIPWDDTAMGELEVRGPWIASSYYNSPEGAKSFTEDGWFKTGDIVCINDKGCIHLQDRAKDVIKSGGEWISSVALENSLMAHPSVAEAAVIPVVHPKWAERPLACVVVHDGQQVTQDELIEHLRPHFAKWWLPDAVEFVDEIPKTSAGKFLKTALREKFQDYYMKAEAT